MNPETDEPRRPVSLFANHVLNGTFVVTGELTLPDSPHPDKLVDTALQLAPYCDALNLTDATSATPHFSSLAAASLLIDNGIEPIMQISCRDRNRIAIQGDVVGAHALGVRNVLCVTGDGVESGDHPSAKPVFDLDSVTLISTISNMVRKGSFESGRPLDEKPDLFIGGAVNPFAPPFDFRPHRVLKKVKAGASFFQSQFCFDVARLREFLEQLEQMSHDLITPIIVGIGPLRSARVAKWMSQNVPGVYIPDLLLERLSGYPREDQAEVGLEIAYEIVDEIKTISGVSGIHLMAYKWESAVSAIVEHCGLGKSARGANHSIEWNL